MKHVGRFIQTNSTGDFDLLDDNNEHVGHGNLESSTRSGEVNMVLYIAGDEPHDPETFLKIEGIPVNLTGFPQRDN